MSLGKDFIHHSNEAFMWRADMAEKIKEWNRRSFVSSEPSRKGYVGLSWLKMIYYYLIVKLYRPTRITAQGIAGNWSVQACCQALLFFRKFQMAKEIAQPWLGVSSKSLLSVVVLLVVYFPARFNGILLLELAGSCSLCYFRKHELTVTSY
jgi:hypothetical protein